MRENHEQAKRRLRRRLRAARSRLLAGAAAGLSVKVCARTVELPMFVAARHLVAYVPSENEVDPGPLAAAARAAGKAIYYPRVGQDRLDFLCPEPDEWVPGPAGIPEPAAGRPLGPDAVRLCFLVPGVAFDPRGVRLGRGGGWYDRALAAHPGAARLGLAYEFQVVPFVPEASWDVRMHVVVTDARVLAGVERSADEKENRP